MADRTRKLFYEDSHQKSFTATVTECVVDENAADAATYWVVLDRTAFFPEGGGQYADTGILSGVPLEEMPDESVAAAVSAEDAGVAAAASVADITDVRERDGIIYHRSDKAFAAGSTVYGLLDWDKRFGKMQQHTGEHIVSGLVHANFGYDNVGFHLADTYCTMDFSGEIGGEDLRRIEWMANGAVVKNLDVEVLYPTKEELAGMEYRSKIEIEGQVRIVVIPGYDTCACCAPHVKKTGEIGMVRLVDWQRYKGGVRVTMLCGFRALSDYRQKSASARQISNCLCVKEADVFAGVEHVKEECARLKQKLADKQRELFSYKVRELFSYKGNESGRDEGDDQDSARHQGVACLFEEMLEGDGGRVLMNLALEAGGKVCAVFWKNGRDGDYRYCIGSTEKDVRELGKALNARFQGRGGGKPRMVQGSLVANEDDLRAWMREESGEWLR